MEPGMEGTNSTVDQHALIEDLLRPTSSAPRPGSPSEKEEQALEKLVAHFSQSNLTLPSLVSHLLSHQDKKKPATQEKDLRPLSEWERCYTLSRESLLRALRSDRWDVEKAKKRLEETIVWRRECGTDTLEIRKQEEVSKKEGATGKLFVLGFDNLQRPIVHMRPKHQNTGVSPARLVFTFWALDRAIDLMPSGQEKMLLAIDLTGDHERPAIKQQMEFLRVLANYYNERLGKAIMIGMPAFFAFAFKIIRPLIDPVTYAKISFDRNDVLKTCPAGQLDANLGGTNPFEWNASYWDVLIAECEKRRAEKLRRWQEAGAKVGLSEWTFDGAEAPQPVVNGNGGDPEKTAVLDAPEARTEVQAVA